MWMNVVNQTRSKVFSTGWIHRYILPLRRPEAASEQGFCPTKNVFNYWSTIQNKSSDSKKGIDGRIEARSLRGNCPHRNSPCRGRTLFALWSVSQSTSEEEDCKRVKFAKALPPPRQSSWWCCEVWGWVHKGLRQCRDYAWDMYRMFFWNLIYNQHIVTLSDNQAWESGWLRAQNCAVTVSH